MEVGISSCRAPLLLTGGGNNAILVKAKGIINGVDPRPMRHPHHIDIKVRSLFVVSPTCMYVPRSRNRNRAFLPSKVAPFPLPFPRPASAHCAQLF